MTAKTPLEPLRIGGVPEHFNLPWHLLLESGDLRRVGIDASWRDFYGGTGEMTAALDNNEIDMAMLLTEGAVAAIARGGRFRIVSVFTASPLIWGIHVPASSELRSVADLQGQRYAISRLGSGSHLMACVHAREQGWSLETMRFETVGRLDEGRKTLVEGRAEIFFWEKFTTQPFVDCGELRRVAEYPTPWPGFVVAVSDQMLKTDPRRCAITLRAVLANAFAMLGRSDAAALIAHRYELIEANVAQWLGVTEWSMRVAVSQSMLDNVAQTLHSVGLLSADQCDAQFTAQL